MKRVKLADRLVALETMSAPALRAEWIQLGQGEPPALPPDLLRRMIAYALQAKRHGGLPAMVARELDQAGRGAVVASTKAPTVAMRPGTRLINMLASSVSLAEHQIQITVDGAALIQLLGIRPAASYTAPAIMLTCEAVRVRHGHELRLIIPVAQQPAAARMRDDKLFALLGEARSARALVMAAPETPLSRIATDANRCRTRLTNLLKPSCLAPGIVTGIIEGRQPATLTAATLMRVDLPLCWNQQRAMLGVS